MAYDFMGRVEGGKVVPRFGVDAEHISCNLEGEEVRCVLTQPKSRSVKQLRLWWGFAQHIADNLPFGQELTAQGVSDLLKIENGHCYVFRDHRGIYRQLPRSIALAKLDQDRFNALMDGAVEAAARIFAPGLAMAAWREICAMMEREK